MMKAFRFFLVFFFLRVDEKAWFNKGTWRFFEHQKWENWNNRPKGGNILDLRHKSAEHLERGRVFRWKVAAYNQWPMTSVDWHPKAWSWGFANDVCLKNQNTDVGMSENGVYPQWNSHLVGIMISKTIGCRGTLFSDKHGCNRDTWGVTRKEGAIKTTRHRNPINVEVS